MAPSGAKYRKKGLAASKNVIKLRKIVKCVLLPFRGSSVHVACHRLSASAAAAVLMEQLQKSVQWSVSKRRAGLDERNGSKKSKFSIFFDDFFEFFEP